ncbi:MAG: ribbon-helix-helix protein, CopG family [Pseudomonadales bacterium]
MCRNNGKLNVVNQLEGYRMARSVRRQYLVTDENIAKLDTLAATEGVSVTEIVRRAIDAYSANEDDAELERLVTMMSDSVRDATKEVRAARKRVRKANLDYAKRKAE